MARRTWGSISKRGAGVWVIRWPKGFDEKTGKRLRGQETIRGTRKQAEQRLAELRVQFRGDVDLSRDISVDEFWEVYYLPNCMHLAQVTIEGYKNHYRNLIKPEFERTPITKITHRMVQQWLDTLSYGSARSGRSLLRAMLNKAQEYELVETHPLNDRYRMPSRDTITVSVNNDVYSLDEMTQIFTEAHGEIWEPAFITGAFGGLRRAESFGLKLDDISRSGEFAILTIQRGVQVINRQVTITAVKTPSSNREVVIPPPFSTRLLEIMDEKRAQGDVWLLDDGFGNPSSPNTIAFHYKNWFVGKSFKFVPFKNLRNSYATALHEHGADLAIVSKMLGHTTPVTTYQHYDKPSVDAKSSVAKLLGQRWVTNYDPSEPNSKILYLNRDNDNKEQAGK